MKINNKKISIIVPVYNASQYLEKCINSICLQTFREIEVILVDDGSTDSSGEICDKYQSMDERIKVIHKNNMGLVAARKTGLKVAKGDYIGFVDADDWIEPEMYEKLYSILNNSDADFVHSCFIQNNNYTNNEEINISHNFSDDIFRIKVINNILYSVYNDSMEYDLSPSIWSKLYKRELITRCYKDVPDEQSYGEDVISLCSCLLNCRGFIFTTASYYHYTIRYDSMSNKVERTRFFKEYALYRSLKVLFEKYGVFKQTENALEKRLDWCMIRHINDIYGDCIEDYYFPQINDFKNRKIIIYGAGRVGKSLYKQFKFNYGDKIVAWIDQNAEINEKKDLIMNIDKIKEIDFDFIIVAVEKKEVADEIINVLKKMRISEGKIIWRRPIRILENI